MSESLKDYEQGFLEAILVIKHYVKRRIKDEKLLREVLELLNEIENAVTERRVEAIEEYLALL